MSGIQRRTASAVVARVLLGVNTTPTRALGAYLLRSPRTAYAALVLLGLLLYKYFPRARRLVVCFHGGGVVACLCVARATHSDAGVVTG